MRELGLEFLGGFGLYPVELVKLAAKLECQFISTPMTPMEGTPEQHEPWSIRDDNELRRELKAALADNGIKLTLGEGFAIMPEVEVREAYARDLDIFRDLGVERINALVLKGDLDRGFDQFAQLVQMADEREIEPVLEFVPAFPVNSLALALKAVDHAGGPAKVLLDTMHFFRSGATIEELKAAPQDKIGHVQLCDVPRVPVIADYFEEAVFERMVPGEGDAPLAEILAVVSPDMAVGLEIPLRSMVEQGIGVRERMARCVAGARTVFERADALQTA